jgi:hypothetical protein
VGFWRYREKLSTVIDSTQAICYCILQMATRLNLRRGFNRIYLILSLLWCLWVLWWPIKGRNDKYSFYVLNAYGDWRGCLENRLKSSQQCAFERDTALADAKRDTLDGNPYLWASGGSYATLLLFPVFMVVPPAIIYGLLFGLAKLGLWIINGFKT